MAMTLNELQDAKAPVASRTKRRWNWLGAISLPLLLCIGGVLVPQWINNQRLNVLADRLLEYPPPPETVILTEVDGSIGVEGREKDVCRFRLRFTVETKLSAAVLRDHYKKAEIPPVDDDGHGFVDVFVWMSSDLPPTLDNFGRQSMIVEIQSRGHGGGGDIRCW